MSARRPLTRTPRGRRAFAAGGLALCIALAPGTAWAEDEAPPPVSEETVTDIVEGGQEVQEQETPEQQEGAEEQEAEETPEPPAFEFPPEVVAALQEFAAQAGFPEDCVTGVVASLERIGNGIAGLPAELQQLLTDLGTAVQEQLAEPDGTALEEFLSGLVPTPPAEGSEEPPAPPVGGDITAGLQDLAAALQACQPAPPSEGPDNTPTPQQPVGHPQPPQAPAPAPQAPQAPIQPAAYPGYAPTGAEEAEDGQPLAPIGLALVVLAGGAAWAGGRWRAARR